MRKTLLIGIDQSYNSTGITVSYLEDLIGKQMNFYRIVFDDKSTKKPKQLKYQKNVTQILYQLPTNISTYELEMRNDMETNSADQIETTLKAMVCSKKILGVVLKNFELYKPDDIYFAIEGFIMPNFGGMGKNQFASLTDLIMLQAHIRDLIVRFLISNSFAKQKILIVNPSELKKFFAHNGNADKPLMIEKFYTEYDGDKLLPKIQLQDTKIDDIVDSFALMMFIYSKILKHENTY